MTYTGKILFCCGIALYIYVARIIIYHDSKISRKEESASEDIASASEPMGLLAGQLLVVTRIHMNAASSLPDVSKVIKFVKDCKNYADGILVCIGAHEHSAAAANQLAEYTQSIQNLLRAEGLDKLNIYFLPISPWGYFTPALNYAVQFAQDHDFDNVAFQSLEVSITEYEVRRVLKRLAVKNTIVVGPVLDGHDFRSDATGSSSRVALTGRTCPWNTFAVWRVRELGFLGFPLIGDGTGEDRGMGGVEELSAITMLQKINLKYTAVLLKIPPRHATADTAGQESVDARATWDTNFADPQRQAYHNKKMESKVTRPAAQMRAMGLEPGTVLHEIDNLM